jgi:hypothetical protein
MCQPRFHVILFVVLAGALLALPAWADSQVRIVRLSDVQGAVQIDKNSGLGFENAFANLPITQGTQLHTRQNGRAEIEFEDGSTVRITPSTTVEFSTLGLNDDGKRVSQLTLVEGRMYVNWLGKAGDEFTLNFSQEKIELRQAAHFRVERSSRSAELASFKNDLEVVSPSGTVKVNKNKMVTFDTDNDDKPTLAKNIEPTPSDEWDQQSIEYHDQYSKNNSTPYGYGYSDLSYYGSYSNLPGFGMLWQPYLAGAGWNPFMDGAWSWYPGMGYMWASAYPWGWMPFYYGNWTYAPGFGWGWQPGGWNTWHGGIHYVGTAVAGFHAPIPPAGTVNTIVVGKGGPVLTKVPATPIVLRSGSAGLGITRGAYGNLRHLSTQVAKSGSIELHAAPQFSASSPASGHYGSMAAAGAAGTGHGSVASSGHAPSSGGHH